MTWALVKGERFWPGGNVRDEGWTNRAPGAWYQITPETYSGPARWTDGGVYLPQSYWHSDVPGNPDVMLTKTWDAVRQMSINNSPPQERLPNGLVLPTQKICTGELREPPVDYSQLPPAGSWATERKLDLVERRIAAGIPLSFKQMAVITDIYSNPWRIGSSIAPAGWIPYENAYNQFECKFIPEKYRPGNQADVWNNFVIKLQDKESGSAGELIPGAGVTVGDMMKVMSLVTMALTYGTSAFTDVATETAVQDVATESASASLIDTVAVPDIPVDPTAGAADTYVMPDIPVASETVPVSQFDDLSFTMPDYTAGDLMPMDTIDVTPDVTTYEPDFPVDPSAGAPAYEPDFPVDPNAGTAPYEPDFPVDPNAGADEAIITQEAANTGLNPNDPAVRAIGKQILNTVFKREIAMGSKPPIAAQKAQAQVRATYAARAKTAPVRRPRSGASVLAPGFATDPYGTDPYGTDPFGVPAGNGDGDVMPAPQNPGLKNGAIILGVLLSLYALSQ